MPIGALVYWMVGRTSPVHGTFHIIVQMRLGLSGAYVSCLPRRLAGLAG